MTTEDKTIPDDICGMCYHPKSSWMSCNHENCEVKGLGKEDSTKGGEHNPMCGNCHNYPCVCKAEDSTENMPDDPELGTRILDFLREIHESDTTPESGDVEHIYSLISEYSDGYYSQAELDRRVADKDIEINRLELIAEDIECANLHLDDLGAAKGEEMDGGFAEYSLVGRIDDVIEKCVAEAEERQREAFINILFDLASEAEETGGIKWGTICKVRDTFLNAGGKDNENT